MNKEQNNNIDRLPRADKNIGSRNDKKNKFLKPALISILALVLIGGTISFKLTTTKAEQSGSTPESGVTSRILSLYNDLTGLTFGSDSDTPDWGTYWNRIKTAAKWVPSGTAVEADVATGKTFYNTTRGAKTGAGTVTNLTPAGPCSSQQYYDGYGAPATETTNCSLPWTANPTPATGDDALAGRGGLDPRTGLTWSQLLLNNAGTVAFSPTTNSIWTWTAAGTNNVAVGNKTASQICSDRGSGWRLPTQKELMQAYIDGSYWNLTQSSNFFWSATELDSTNAWRVALYSGLTTIYVKSTNNSPVRCVRP